MDRSLLDAWLQSTLSSVVSRKYRHHLLSEKPTGRADIISDLKSYVATAHQDAKRHIDHIAGVSLDPQGRAASGDPLPGYPSRLPQTTLQGYFGEIFASIAASIYGAGGHSDWEVPAFLFRSHKIAFEYLEVLQQSGTAHQIPGRHGEDSVAFKRTEDGKISKVLFSEAKCLTTHSSAKIQDAHKKLSGAEVIPGTILEIIEILQDSNLPDSADWVSALRFFRSNGGAAREDLAVYVCGQRPTRNPSWISQTQPHTSYTGSRELEAFEVHIDNLTELVLQVYGET